MPTSRVGSLSGKVVLTHPASVATVVSAASAARMPVVVLFDTARPPLPRDALRVQALAQA
jgi:hypothetical protein